MSFPNSEIGTIGYPQAALFALCLALVALNLYAVVMAALLTQPKQSTTSSQATTWPGR
jgi:hypothetical protein